MEDVRWLNEQEDRAWRGYAEMSGRLAAYLHRSLNQKTGLSLPDYEVLVHLSESPHDRMRAYELGASLQWEKSRLSHHLRRMEGRGLVNRQMCETDARGLFIVLTPEGRKAIEEAAPHHVSDVRQMLIDQLTPEEMDMLATVAGKVVSRLSATEAACDD